uniref:Uncharacterized protein n=1 Tax=Oryza rufipogon TaxID=4529 RepID=A0A0E0N507_ORYRU
MASLLQLLPDRVPPCAAAEAPLRFLFDAFKLLNEEKNTTSKAPTIESTAFLYVARLIASSSQNSCDLHIKSSEVKCGISSS